MTSWSAGRINKRAFALVAFCSALCGGCEPSAAVPSHPPRPEVVKAGARVVYAGGLQNGWKDFGWAKRELNAGEPARVEMANYGGWIVANPAWAKEKTPLPGALTFRLRTTGIEASARVGFLEVRLGHADKRPFPSVRVRADHARTQPGGWQEIAISTAELNPRGMRFDRVRFRAAAPVGKGWVELDDVAFFGEAPAPLERTGGKRAYHPGRFVVDCTAQGTPISDEIYGIAYNARKDKKQQWLWELRPSARRWGGNAMSRYNWRLGNAWNTASDWFFENTNFTGDATFSWERFYEANAAHRAGTAITIPLLGWVAKDTRACSFDTGSVGVAQQKTDPYRKGCGNGLRKDGEPLPAPDPTTTSVRADAAFLGPWIDAIAKKRAQSERPHLYLLGNEPMLWDSTHRDVHPEPVGYDELWERTLVVAREIRKRDPQARIAGPGLWGWPAYAYSAKDAKAGFFKKPDRRAHDDAELLAWYLRKLREHEARTGERLLDLVDVHFYPQDGIHSSAHDEKTAARRIRSTRALWDPSYVDESWIDAPVQLIGRIKARIDANYPGRGLVIGEYNFGAEDHMSGGLALAEALGRFGRHGVTAAFYWTYPPKGTPAFDAFAAYRNYDGEGAHFLSRALPATAPEGASLFASTDERGELVLVLLNFSTHVGIDAEIALKGCKELARRRHFARSGEMESLTKRQAPQYKGHTLTVRVEPYSINVLELSPRAAATPPPSPPPRRSGPGGG